MLPILIVSAAGFTVSVMVVLLESPLMLVAVAVKLKVCVEVPAATVGAVKVTTDPSAAPCVSAIPSAEAITNLSAPPVGSTPLAVRVTVAPLLATVVGAPFMVATRATDGGVPGGGGMTGTDTVAVEGAVVFPPPTVSWKLRLSGEDTTGAMNVALALAGFVIVTSGSPGLTICTQANGPFAGELPLEVSVTLVPAVIAAGGCGLKPARALAAF